MVCGDARSLVNNVNQERFFGREDLNPIWGCHVERDCDSNYSLLG